VEDDRLTAFARDVERLCRTLRVAGSAQDRDGHDEVAHGLEPTFQEHIRDDVPDTRPQGAFGSDLGMHPRELRIQEDGARSWREHARCDVEHARHLEGIQRTKELIRCLFATDEILENGHRVLEIHVALDGHAARRTSAVAVSDHLLQAHDCHLHGFISSFLRRWERFPRKVRVMKPRNKCGRFLRWVFGGISWGIRGVFRGISRRFVGYCVHVSSAKC
jgi:hypothetical protein